MKICPIFGFLGFTKSRSTCCKQDNGRAVQASLPFPSFLLTKSTVKSHSANEGPRSLLVTEEAGNHRETQRERETENRSDHGYKKRIS